MLEVSNKYLFRALSTYGGNNEKSILTIVRHLHDIVALEDVLHNKEFIELLQKSFGADKGGHWEILQIQLSSPSHS